MIIEGMPEETNTHIRLSGKICSKEITHNP